VKKVVEREEKEAKRRKAAYTQRDITDYSNYDRVIVTDDALATGATMKSAIATLKHLNAKNIIMAVPVGPKDTIEQLKTQVNEVVVAMVPPNFRAASLHYHDWR
jgi:putative phosphoribosyl transferase